METQGMTLLLDLKKSIRKRLYRQVVKRIERKIQKDPSFLKNNYFLEILLEQIEAVHGLLEQVIIGRFDKCSSKVDTLVKIMNRNLKICYKLLKYRMGSGQYLDLKAYKLSSFIEDYRTVENKKKFSKYLSLLLSSCYYIHMLRLFKGYLTSQFQPHINQCQSLITLLSQMSKSNFKIQLTISKLQILVMSINIKQNNKNEATLQFYEALSNLLIALKILESKSISDIRLYRRYKKSILVLINIAFINYQRMQIWEGNFVGWETGFGLVKAIEKQLRGQQNSWAKYLRTQYEKDHEISTYKMDQIRKIYLPFVINQSQVISEILKATKNSKKCYYQQLLLVAAKSKNQPKKLAQTHGQNQLSLKLQTLIPFFTDHLKQFTAVSKTKIKSSYNIQLSNTSPQAFSNIKKSKVTNRKNILKASKFPSIDWLQSMKIKSNVTQFMDLTINKSDENIEKYVANKKTSQQTKRTNRLKTQRKQKRNTHQINLLTDQDLKLQSSYSKKKQKSVILHRLITYTEEKNFPISKNSREISSPQFKSPTKRQTNQIETDRKSFEHCLTDVFINLLTQNKNKLKIKELVNSYELAKKRRKIRNYNLQILEFQLHKSISNFVTSGKNQNCWSRKKNSRKEKHTSIAKFIRKQQGKESSLMRKQHVLRENQNIQNQNIINEKQIQCCHNRSKEVIREMLKKITAGNTKAKLKKSVNSSFSRPQLFLSYRPME